MSDHKGKRSIRFARGCVNESGKNSVSLSYNSVLNVWISRPVGQYNDVLVLTKFPITPPESFEFVDSPNNEFCSLNRIDVNN